MLVPGVSLWTERLPAGGILRPARELRVVGQLGPAQLRVHHAQHQDGGGGGEDGHDDEDGEAPPSPEPVSLRLHVQVLQNIANMVYITQRTAKEKENGNDERRLSLKVHKHEIFFCTTRFLKIVFNSAEIFDF